MDALIVSRIALETTLPETSVAATVDLFEKGATVPFILRYRKEATGSFEEPQVRTVHERYLYYRELQDRRASVLKLVSDQGKLTDGLRARIEGSYSKVELEDLFHQFRPKKRTRASEAVERGLEPLAEYLWNQELDAWSLQEHIDVFVDPAKNVPTREAALQGATEIIAQWIADDIDLRKALRDMLWTEGVLVSAVVPAKREQKTKYTMYYDRREPVATIPSHRVLAIRRGSKEGILTSSIEGNNARAVEYILGKVVRDKESAFAPILEAAVRDSYTRILRPLIETEVRAQLKERADREAIRVFQENLANLLLSPPAGHMVVAGLDVVKSGECAVAVVDDKGSFLEDRVIRFTAPKGPSPRVQQPAAVRPAPPAAGTEGQAEPATEPVSREAELADAPLTPAFTAPIPDEGSSEAVAELPVSPAPELAGDASPGADALPAEAAVADSGPGLASDTPVDAIPEADATGIWTGLSEVEPSSVGAAAETVEFGSAPEPPANNVTVGEPEQAGTPTREFEPADPVAAEALPADRQAAEETVPAEPGASAGGVETSSEPPQDTPAQIPAEVSPPPTAQPAVDYMARARTAIRELVAKYSVQAIAIGTGAGARELETTLRRILAEEKIENVLIAPVNDAGIAVYSSSRVAREELPDLGASARCAVSLARRLQDPLAEMVKIDPKLIGVGQYQHDVDQKELHRGLLQTVQNCVNKVGVDVNAADYPLLRYVSGVNDRLAHRIVGFRKASGPFPTRLALQKVPGFDPGAFELAAGFMRIRGGENPLDATAIHPESYPIVEKMAASLGVGVPDLIGNKDLVGGLKLEDFVADGVGIGTLTDIKDELLRPGRDPRKAFALPKFRTDVTDLNDLKKGMTLEGTVTNVTNFGAFVDIGVRQDGLVHLSQMSNRFIRDPREAVKVGDVVQVKVISVEVETKRIGLSMKALLPPPGRRRPKARRPGGRPQQEAVLKAGEGAAPEAGSARGEGAPPSPGRRPRRDRDRGRPWRREEGRRPERPVQTAPDPKPQVPEPSLQEKIAILQSKFRGIH